MNNNRPASQRAQRAQNDVCHFGTWHSPRNPCPDRYCPCTLGLEFDARKIDPGCLTTSAAIACCILRVKRERAIVLQSNDCPGTFTVRVQSEYASDSDRISSLQIDVGIGVLNFRFVDDKRIGSTNVCKQDTALSVAIDIIDQVCSRRISVVRTVCRPSATARDHNILGVEQQAAVSPFTGPKIHPSDSRLQ